MKIRVDDLAAAVNRILDYTRRVHGDSVEVPAALYWFVQAAELYDVTKVPEALTIGSLEDDWERLTAVAAGKEDPFGYMLVWASAVLRCLGDRLA